MKKKNTQGHSPEQDALFTIPQHVIESLARCALPGIQQFFESEEGKQEFEQWKAMQSNKSET